MKYFYFFFLVFLFSSNLLIGSIKVTPKQNTEDDFEGEVFMSFLKVKERIKDLNNKEKQLNQFDKDLDKTNEKLLKLN